MNKLGCLIVMFIACKVCEAQIDLQCNGRDMHSLYLVNFQGFFRTDSVDTNPTNEITLAPNQLSIIGISINNNLDSMTGSETMYCIGNGTPYYFWNGTGWSNTGSMSGNNTAVNPGGSSSFIFNLDALGNSIYRYDGTGNGTLLISNLGTNGASVYDVATDSQGNFYLFYTMNHKILMYNFNGIPVDTFTTSGFPNSVANGFAILGNNVYAIGPTDLYKGIKTGNNINFILIKQFSNQFIDMAACPNAGIPLAVFKYPDQPHFAVYPNPVHDIAIIKLDNTSLLEIYDHMGIIRTTVSTKGLSEYQLDVSKWKAGVYLINALSGKKTSSCGKLIVE